MSRVIKCENTKQEQSAERNEPRFTMKIVRALSTDTKNEGEITLTIPANQIVSFHYSEVNCKQPPTILQPDASTIGPMLVAFSSLTPLEITCDNYDCAYSRRITVRI